jgi:hypothetical protein
MLRQYIRDKQGRPCGVVVSDKLCDQEIYFGYSLCNTKKGDKFNKNRGLEIAVGRLMSRKFSLLPYDIPRYIELPPKILVTLDHIKQRSKRYFKKGTKDENPSTIC